MNKQEKNIEDIFVFEDTKEIVDYFLNHSSEEKETIAIIARKELVKYVFDKAVHEKHVDIAKVDLEIDGIEYMISIDRYGNVVVQPVEYFDEKYFNDIEFAYISMDEDVSQITIDYLLNRDIPIVLFGKDIDSENEKHDCDTCPFVKKCSKKIK